MSVAHSQQKHTITEHIKFDKKKNKSYCGRKNQSQFCQRQKHCIHIRVTSNKEYNALFTALQNHSVDLLDTTHAERDMTPSHGLTDDPFIHASDTQVCPHIYTSATTAIDQFLRTSPLLSQASQLQLVSSAPVSVEHSALSARSMTHQSAGGLTPVRWLLCGA